MAKPKEPEYKPEKEEVKIKNRTGHYSCDTCKMRCDNKSLGKYVFEDDRKFSETIEELVRKYFNGQSKYEAREETNKDYPDIRILKEKRLVARVEIKAQARAFMKVKKMLPEGELSPETTVALNLSDLLRYFKLYNKEQIPIFIAWRVERPCLGIRYYYQQLTVLKNIYNKYKDKRRFRRKSGVGNNVNGKHKGVVVNYHFSINELKDLKEIIVKLNDIVNLSFKFRG